MALPDDILVQNGTDLVVKNSGGDAAITLASLANSTSESTGARQAVKLDLGATRAEYYRVWATFEIAATPTAGNVIEIWWSPSNSATAGTDNMGNATGTDAAYTGYSSNITESLQHCQFVGAFVCTPQATTTVQKGQVAGKFAPADRYGNLIVWNKSGAALHSTETNQSITLSPIEGTVID